MKKLFFILPVLIASSLLLSNACRKSSEPTLPKETQNGANTAGCLINGKLWISEGCGGFSFPQEREKGYFSYDVIKKRLIIFFQRCNDKERSFFSFTIENYKGPGQYNCDKTSYIPGIPGSAGLRNSHMWLYSAKGPPLPDDSNYITFEEATGSITITKVDTISRPLFASGTFECKLKNLYNYNDSIIIAKGRFDIINQ